MVASIKGLRSRQLIILRYKVTAAFKVNAVATRLDSIPLVYLNVSLAPAANFLSTLLSLGKRSIRDATITKGAIINDHISSSLPIWDNSTDCALLHILSCNCL